MKSNHQKGTKAVFGIYNSQLEVSEAVNQLKRGSFRNQDISVLMPTQDSTKNFAHEKSTKAPEGAASGVTGGAILGGSLGWLAGIGALAIPGVGPFVAAGPIMAALAGATVGGAVGGITGALIGMGIPEYEAKRFESYVKKGGILLSVHVDDSEWLAKAKLILTNTGAKDIASAGEVEGDMKNNSYQDAGLSRVKAKELNDISKIS